MLITFQPSTVKGWGDKAGTAVNLTWIDPLGRATTKSAMVAVSSWRLRRRERSTRFSPCV